MPIGAAAMPGLPNPAATPPVGTPSGAGQDARGDMAQAKAQVSIAINILSQCLPMLGAQTEEGKSVMKALTSLSKSFSDKKSEDLVPAELMNIMQTMPDSNKQQVMKEMAPPQGGGMRP